MSLRLTDPRTTALVFASGKIVCIGAKTVNLAKLAMSHYFRKIRRVCPESIMCNVTIQNMVASGSLGRPIDVGEIAQKHRLVSIYSPELFPGLRLRIVTRQNKIMKTLVFKQGTAVIIGAKTTEDVSNAWEALMAIVL